MTELPFKEKDERRILLPDDDPLLIGYVVAFLYKGDFLTRSEEWLRNERATGKTSRHRKTIVKGGQAFPKDDAAKSDPLTEAETAVAEDLAKVYMLADKYQLGDMRNTTLEKLQDLIAANSRPIGFLHAITICYRHIPETDLSFPVAVREILQEAFWTTAVDMRDIADWIVKRGYLKVNEAITEAIVHAFAFAGMKGKGFDSARSDAGSD